VNSRYQLKWSDAKRCHFHLLDCPNGFQRERHERIGQSRSVTVTVTGASSSASNALMTGEIESFILCWRLENTH